MAVHDIDHPVALRVSRAEPDLLRVAVCHLLASEDDPEMIAELKALLARLPSWRGPTPLRAFDGPP